MNCRCEPIVADWTNSKSSPLADLQALRIRELEAENRDLRESLARLSQENGDLIKAAKNGACIVPNGATINGPIGFVWVGDGGELRTTANTIGHLNLMGGTAYFEQKETPFFTVHPASDSPRDKSIADFCHKALEREIFGDSPAGIITVPTDDPDDDDCSPEPDVPVVTDAKPTRFREWF